MNTSFKKKIAIVGAGAIGANYGVLLARAGHDVHFLLRSDYESVRANGYRLKLPDEEIILNSVNAHKSTDTIGPCDVVIIALKTTANAVFSEVLPALNNPGKTVFVTLQNGMGNVERLTPLFGTENVVGGVCFVCINRTAHGVIENYMPGYVHLAEVNGPATERTQALAEMFSGAGCACKAVDSLDRMLWYKLCWNVPFNGIAISAGGITTDKIVGRPTLRELAGKLMCEIQAAAAAYGVEISDKHLENQMTVTDKMGAYKPSSLLDYLAGKPVEVESIWGEPLRRGKARGVPMKNLECLYESLVQVVKQ